MPSGLLDSLGDLEDYLEDLCGESYPSLHSLHERSDSVRAELKRLLAPLGGSLPWVGPHTAAFSGPPPSFGVTSVSGESMAFNPFSVAEGFASSECFEPPCECNRKNGTALHGAV